MCAAKLLRLPAADNGIRGRAGWRSWTSKPPIHKFQVHGWLKVIGHGLTLTLKCKWRKEKYKKKKIIQICQRGNSFAVSINVTAAESGQISRHANRIRFTAESDAAVRASRRLILCASRLRARMQTPSPTPKHRSLFFNKYTRAKAMAGCFILPLLLSIQ